MYKRQLKFSVKNKPLTLTFWERFFVSVRVSLELFNLFLGFARRLTLSRFQFFCTVKLVELSLLVSGNRRA